MRLVLASLFGLVLVANGLFMLLDPAIWYAQVPGVPQTGPLNLQFVRDIGCTYVVTGAAFIGYAFEVRLRVAALARALFLTLHALVHIADVAAGRELADQELFELVAIFAPAAIALWLVLASDTRRTTNVQVADEVANYRLRTRLRL
jgi:uncharacterized protein YjeT (DUF2065 family)